MIPPPAGLRRRRNGQSPITHHHVLASAGRHLARGDIETAGRPASGGMIPPLVWPRRRRGGSLPEGRECEPANLGRPRGFSRQWRPAYKQVVG